MCPLPPPLGPRLGGIVSLTGGARHCAACARLLGGGFVPLLPFFASGRLVTVALDRGTLGRGRIVSACNPTRFTRVTRLGKAVQGGGKPLHLYPQEPNKASPPALSARPLGRKILFKIVETLDNSIIIAYNRGLGYFEKPLYILSSPRYNNNSYYYSSSS